MNKWRQWMAMKQDDGLGGSAGGAATAVPAGDVDPILEEPGYLADGGEFPPDPGTETPGEAPDPFAGFPDEVRAKAAEKGWKDPADMWRAYQGAESLVGQRDERTERLQRERDELAAKIAAGSPPAAPGGTAPAGDDAWTVDFEALEAAAQGDPQQMMKLYHENVIPQILQDFGAHMMEAVNKDVGAAVAPLQQHTGQQMLKDQATQLARDFPQDFSKHREELVQLVASRPEYRDSPRGMTQAFHELLARDRAREIAAARGNEGESLIGNRNPQGGGNRPVRDVAAETRAAIEAAMPGVRDGLS